MKPSEIRVFDNGGETLDRYTIFPYVGDQYSIIVNDNYSQQLEGIYYA